MSARKTPIIIFYVINVLIIFFLSITQAQESADQAVSSEAQQSNVNAKKQVINFEDELIEGSAQKPELFYLLQKKNSNYKRLIKLRENFLPEMRRGSEDIRRLRGGR